MGKMSKPKYASLAGDSKRFDCRWLIEANPQAPAAART